VTTRRKPPTPTPAEVEEPTVDVAAARSLTGVQLDPVDGWPVFAGGMSRRRWLHATRDQRKAQLIEDLRAAAAEGTESE
jgi:hypothetical protein